MLLVLEESARSWLTYHAHCVMPGRNTLLIITCLLLAEEGFLDIPTFRDLNNLARVPLSCNDISQTFLVIPRGECTATLLWQFSKLKG